ncbi:MAG TPA: hypothetical protein VI759_02135 [Dehalococcoidia bacterium]|nr:hypothetical protein [Dehalococcoidia bacterium]
MASINESIHVEKSAAVARLVYYVVARNAAGEPVEGEELVVTLDGSGSLSPKFSSKDIRRVSDQDGSAVLAWYRSGIWDRDVKATLTVAPINEALSVTLRPATQDEIDVLDGPRISHTKSRLF